MRTLFILFLFLMAGCEYKYDDGPVAPYETRDIQVNGDQLDHQAMIVFDELFGFKLHNGAYWVNDAGQWGFGNNPNPAGVINMQALARMQVEQAQAEQQFRAQQQGNGGVPSRGGGMPNGRSVNGSVVSGKLDGKNCTFITASGGMTIKTCN